MLLNKYLHIKKEIELLSKEEKIRFLKLLKPTMYSIPKTIMVSF